MDDITKYKDPKHYHYTINTWILKEISINSGLLTAESIDNYIKYNTEKAKDYDLIDLGNKIDTYIKSEKTIER